MILTQSQRPVNAYNSKKKKSIWKGFKSKKNKKDLDVLLQKVLKPMTTTSVMVVKSLEVMKTVVDIDEVKNLT